MIKKMRDAIILAMLKDGTKSRRELELRLDIQKKITNYSLSYLRNSGLIRKRRFGGREYYSITESGKSVVEGVFRRG